MLLSPLLFLHLRDQSLWIQFLHQRQISHCRCKQANYEPHNNGKNVIADKEGYAVGQRAGDCRSQGGLHHAQQKLLDVRAGFFLEVLFKEHNGFPRNFYHNQSKDLGQNHARKTDHANEKDIQAQIQGYR